jgi:hypothetical protein
MKSRSMTLCVFCVLCFFTVCSVQGDDRGELIFQDGFERSESQEMKDQVGNGWGTNSNSRAKGNKQVDLRDGAMYIYIHQEADHAVSVVHEAAFEDGSVELRFMFENEKDTLGLDFADLQCKEVHAGHLFKVTVGAGKVDISDLKSGSMSMDVYEMKKSGKPLPKEVVDRIKATKKVVQFEFETGKWYTLNVDNRGDTVSVAIDGKDVSSFASEGFSHPTKKLLRLAVPHQAVVDEVKIFAANK